jgi:hypothetical protein
VPFKFIPVRDAVNPADAGVEGTPWSFLVAESLESEEAPHCARGTLFVDFAPEVGLQALSVTILGTSVQIRHALKRTHHLWASGIAHYLQPCVGLCLWHSTRGEERWRRLRPSPGPIGAKRQFAEC